MLIYDAERPEISLALTENRINHYSVKVAVNSSEFLAVWLFYNLGPESGDKMQNPIDTSEQKYDR